MTVEPDATEAPEPRAPAAPRTFGSWLRDMPRWKKIAVGTAILFVAVGGVWSLTAGVPPAPGGTTPTGLSAALVDSQTGAGGAGVGTAAAPEEPTSKGVFRLGFSFLAGFCVGSFIRATLKIAAIAFGFWLVMTFALAYYGLVVVDWSAIDALWNRFVANVESEWGNFSRFMLGSLPATGLGATGLAIGLRRH